MLVLPSKKIGVYYVIPPFEKKILNYLILAL